MAKRTAASTPARKRPSTKKKLKEPTEEDVRLRAYHRYLERLERGASEGGDFDDWLEAEKDLKPTRS